MPQSNQSGRTLEYAIVAVIISNHPKDKIELSARLVNNQKKDQVSFLALPEKVRLQHMKYASIVYQWLSDDFRISQKEIVLDRMSDVDAKYGDVTDIRITMDGSNLNLSVKHNHFALKHQRPSTTAIRCGFAPKSKEDLEFRKDLGNITGAFIINSSKDYPDATLFNEIKSQSPTYINKNLYFPVCNLISGFINKYSDRINVVTLFKFLVGDTDFYKVTAFKKQIVIEEFARLQKPTSVTTRLKGDSYIILNFSNGWDISLRLHTASSKIGKNPSLKFDTLLINSDMPSKYINV